MAADRSQGVAQKQDATTLTRRTRQAPMRVAINLLTEDPRNPSGAHWFWTRVIPEMAKRLESGEELYLLVSPKSRHLHQDYGPNVFYITYPWSNEHRYLRTLSSQTRLVSASGASNHALTFSQEWRCWRNLHLSRQLVGRE